MRIKKKSVLQVTLLLIPAITLLIVVAFSKNLHHTLLTVSGLTKQCKPTQHASGFTRNTMLLAELSAVSQWSKKVAAHGTDYNFWSNAEKKLTRCLKIKGTRLITCQVWASPCRNKHQMTPSIQMTDKGPKYEKFGVLY